jgi:hypothetical protein
MRLRAVDLLTRRPLPQGEIGELAVSGYVTPGYYRAPELDAEAFDKDGYFLTGDLGSIEMDGRIRFRGRLEQDSKRLNRKGDSHERGIVIQDSGWGEGASIEWQDPIRRTCGIVWLVRWQAAAPVGRRRHCLG